MGAIQDALVRVVEGSKEHAGSNGPMNGIGQRDQDATVLREVLQGTCQQRFAIDDMLKNVSEENDIENATFFDRKVVVQISLVKLIQLNRRCLEVDAGDVVAPGLNRQGQFSTSAAYVEHLRRLTT